MHCDHLSVSLSPSFPGYNSTMASTATCANTEHVPQGFKPAEARTTPGVARIEALFLVYSGRRAHWVLYSCIGLFAFVFSLQTSTVPTFFVISTSSFGQHSLLGAITVANTILAAVVTPFIAKIADVTSRPRAYLLSLFFVSNSLLTALFIGS